MRGRAREGKVLKGWEEEKKVFLEKKRWTLVEMERMRKEIPVKEKIEERRTVAKG